MSPSFQTYVGAKITLQTHEETLSALSAVREHECHGLGIILLPSAQPLETLNPF